MFYSNNNNNGDDDDNDDSVDDTDDWLQPLVVMTSVPTLCANAVQALVNMISPLKFSLDFRPFFTIHDSEFKEYTTRTQSP